MEFIEVKCELYRCANCGAQLALCSDRMWPYELTAPRRFEQDMQPDKPAVISFSATTKRHACGTDLN